MYDNYNYPAGADTPDAPWNQSDPPEIELEVEVVETMTRTATVVTNDAWYVTDEEGCTELEDSNFDAQKTYQDQFYTLQQTIELAKEEIQKLHDAAKDDVDSCYTKENGRKYVKDENREAYKEKSARLRDLKALLENLEGWETSEIEVS